MNEMKGTSYDDEDKILLKKNFTDFAFKHKA